MFDVLQLHQALVAAARPSGAEHTGIAKVLKEMAAPYVDEIKTDAMGNLICHKKGKGKKVMLCAHMDAIGFMVTGIDQKGFLSVNNVGYHTPARIINTRILFSNGVQGILRPRERAKTLSKKWSAIQQSDLYVDIGASTYQEAAKQIKIGDVAVLEGLPEKIAGGRVMGPYADDLIGCVILLLTMEKLQHSKYDVYFVFSVQEEIGARGAHTASMGIRPEIGIACDVCGAYDSPDRDKGGVVVLGKGPTIKLWDRETVCSPALNQQLRKIAQKAGIIWQDEIMVGGYTDTFPMQRSGPDVMASCVSIPTRHIHSPAEIYDIHDVEQAGALLAAFLNH